MKKVSLIVLAVFILVGCSTGKNQVASRENTIQDAKYIRQLISQLGAEDWQTREKAQKDLTKIGEKLIEQYKKSDKDKREKIKGKIKLFADALREGCKSKELEMKMRANKIRQHFYSLTILKIAFISKGTVYMMDEDGKNQTQVTTKQVYSSKNPDGKRIVSRPTRNGNFEIYIMDADGKNQTRLTNNNVDDMGPAWSPDGKKIAFYSNRDGNNEIYVMDSDGKNQTRLTNNKSLDFMPAWSPDGRKIIFSSYRDGNEDIYVMDRDGKNEINLTKNKAPAIAPIWSPIYFPEISKMFVDNEKK